jgi:pimeloyl-ACP methyl ester carboxylesterase
MQINGHELKTRIQGKGPLFVWGHGLTGSMRSEDALNLFAWKKFPRNICLLRYDARGHGESAAGATPGEYHWAELGRDMTALAQKHAKADGYVLGGQSMGCATTLYAALQCPGQVRGLVLVNPPTAWKTRAAQGSLYRKTAWLSGVLGGRLLAEIMRRDMRRALPFWLLETRAEQLSGMLAGLRSMRRCTLFNLFRGAALTDLPALAELAVLKMPTLILAWSDDPTHPLQTAEELEQILPGAQLHVAASNEDVLLWPGLISEFVSKVSAQTAL